MLEAPARRPPMIGTAGSSVPREVADQFPLGGSALERYAARFNAVEINSTFYRSHRPDTYARWAETTPPGFRFALKLPRAITHDARLVDVDASIATFRGDVEALGDKLGPLLVQLPPTLAFVAEVVEAFLADLRGLWAGSIVCEPRHPSWFEPEADAVLAAWRVGRVATDPTRHPAAATPGGWVGVIYWRMHGTPRMYYSGYDDTALEALAAAIRTTDQVETWCVFDNTASGAAAADALRLQRMLNS